MMPTSRKSFVISDLQKKMVSADIDGIGDEERNRCDDQERDWKFFAECAGKTPARNHPNPGTHKLHATHERPGEESGPKHRGTLLRTRDGVSGDTRGIIVRCSGNQTRAEIREEAANRIAFFRLSFLVHILAEK